MKIHHSITKTVNSLISAGFACLMADEASKVYQVARQYIECRIDSYKPCNLIYIDLLRSGAIMVASGYTSLKFVQKVIEFDASQPGMRRYVPRLLRPKMLGPAIPPPFNPNPAGEYIGVPHGASQ